MTVPGDPTAALYSALGADLLRSNLLGAPLPKLGGRYIREKIVGRGASGVVVSAVDDRLGRPVALKLRVTGSDATMLDEARALARLDHPNVVRVHDVDIVSGTFDGTPFRSWLVSMQLVPGRSLRSWLAEKPRSLDAIVRAFVESGRGLAAAHRERIVHRDFKPDNVIVREHDGVAMVLDFGFAIPMRSSRGDASDSTPLIAGTDPYMAPEAHAGNATRRSDQYAFGVSVVEALTGAPTPAHRRPRSVPRGIWSVAVRATAARAERRFADMEALLDALQAARSPPTGSWRRVAVIGTPLIAAGAFVAMGGIDATRLTRLLNAGPDAATAGIIAPRTDCRSEAGDYRFRLRRTHGGPADDITEGVFHLNLRAPPSLVRGTLSRTGHALPRFDVLSVDPEPACLRRVVVGTIGRQYVFRVHLEDDRITGTFESTLVPGGVNFGGVVESMRR